VGRPGFDASSPAPLARPRRTSRGGPPLVGREGELARLEAELGRSRAGELRCILLLGEPGVGKTRLAVDERGAPVPAGVRSAKVYLTHLFNPVLPLIRYERTDEVTVLDGRCPCGCAHRMAPAPPRHARVAPRRARSTPRVGAQTEGGRAG
jgi:AAA ATPase domain